MPQKLSAMNYIKNNKRRVAVLIVSLSLCFVMTYLTQFLLSMTNESMGSILTGSTLKLQNIIISEETLGIDGDDMSDEEYVQAVTDGYKELANKLNAHNGIKKAYTAQLSNGSLTPLIGNMNFLIPFVNKEEAAEIIEYMGASLIEGRMPENECEMALDSATMMNNDLRLNDEHNYKLYGKPIKIVGVLDCDDYFGCGIASDGDTDGNIGMITILSNIKDISAELEKEGIKVVESRDHVIDYIYGEKMLRSEVTDTIDNATTYVYIGILILLSIALVIVYTMYLRDRSSEWCLYCSIGYSRKTIYLSILRELLFTFITALAIGGIIIGISVLILQKVIVEPSGLKSRYFHPDTLWEIFCSYTLILGILQIPVRYSLYKIRTIDALGDDLY